MTPKQFKQKILENKYYFYGDKNLIPTLKESSIYALPKPAIELFSIRKFVNDDDLEKEYELRGLMPAHPEDILDFWTDEGHIGTHWKDGDDKWCFATFDRWDGGERSVRVGRSVGLWDVGWGDDFWFFAGLRKHSELESEPSSETLPLSEEMPEYNFAQLRLLIHALEQLDTSFYEEPYKMIHQNLIGRFRNQLKEYEVKL